MEVESFARPVGVRASVTVPALARPVSNGRSAPRVRAWAVPATPREGRLAEAYARASTRRYDLVLDYAWEEVERYAFEVPKTTRMTTRIVSVPSSRRVEGPFGSFQMDTAIEANGLRATARVQLRIARHRIAATDYAMFRAFLGQVDEALAQEIRLEALP